METDQLIVVSLAAVLVGTTFEAKARAIRWIGIAVAAALVFSSFLSS